MPKKKNQDTQAEKRERFGKSVRNLAEAGGLHPTEADEAMDKIVTSRGFHRRS